MLAKVLQRGETLAHQLMFRLWPILLMATIAASAKEPELVKEDFLGEIQPLLRKYCFDCHGEKKSKAGIRVDYMDGSVPDKEVRHWEMIRKQLAKEEMPPEDEAQPSKAERAALVAWIDGALQMARPRVRPKTGGASPSSGPLLLHQGAPGGPGEKRRGGSGLWWRGWRPSRRQRRSPFQVELRNIRYSQMKRIHVRTILKTRFCLSILTFRAKHLHKRTSRN